MKHKFNMFFGLLLIAATLLAALGVTPAYAAVAPTVTTDSVETMNNRQVNITISDLGSPASVDHHGVVFNTTGNPTLSDSKIDHGIANLGTYHIGLDEMVLTAGTKYYVKAFATNATGTSYGAELVVYGTPGAFDISAPTNSATGVSISPTLSWSASTSATDYQYCAAVNLSDCTSNMTGPNWLSSGGATSVNLSNLLPGSNYSWGVRAVVGTPPSYKWATTAPATFTTSSAPTHTVTYAAGGGTGTAPTQGDVSEGASFTVAANTFTKTGFTFSGWKDQSNVSYAAGSSYTMGTSNVTLTAQWTASSQPEHVVNGGFNTYTGASKVPTSWVVNRNFSATDGKDTTAKQEGTASVKMTGESNTKVLKQVIIFSGRTGNPMTFSFWVKGKSIPTGAVCSGQVIFYNNTNIKSIKTIKCGNSAKFQQKTLSFTAPAAFTKVVIKFTFKAAAGTVWFDGVSLTK